MRAFNGGAGDPQLCRDCASILENLKWWSDAAELYERGQSYERAATIYIQEKEFDKARPLMARVSSPALHLRFAKAMVAVGRVRQLLSAWCVSVCLYLPVWCVCVRACVRVWSMLGLSDVNRVNGRYWERWTRPRSIACFG